MTIFKQKVIISFLILIGLPLMVFSQSRIIENISKMKLQNVGTILEEGEVKGYYFFYQTDKLGKRIFAYELQIVDQNLGNPIVKTIEGSKYLHLIEGCYNRNAIALKFYDAKTKEVIHKAYDRKAKEISSVKRKARRMEIYGFSAALNGSGGQSVTLFPVDKTGVLDYTTAKHKKWGFEIEFYSTNPAFKNWIYKSDEMSTEVLSSTHIYSDDKVVISAVLKKTKFNE